MPKRLRSGELKPSAKPKSQGKSDFSISADLESEILALGGSKEDYELITGDPSDSEYENNESAKESGKVLQKDLKKLVKELGIAKAAAQHPDPEGDDALLVEHDFSTDDYQDITGGTGRGATQFPAQSDWHAAELPPLSEISEPSEGLPSDLLHRVHTHAKSLLEAENTLYGSKTKSATSAHQFYSTIMSSGTLSDKISALTLSVQESPLHNMKALETLLG